MKKKILIVEDDEDLLFFLKISLEDHYKVHISSSAKEYKNKYKKVNPDISLVDVKLPDENGDKVALEVKKKNRPHKVVLMSAWDDVDIRAKKIGADGYIRKPFSLNKLINVIKEVEEGLEN